MNNRFSYHYLVAFAILLGLARCDFPQNLPNNGNTTKYPNDLTNQNANTRGEIATFIRKTSFNQDVIPQYLVTILIPTYAVHYYRITYKTLNSQGQLSTASGAVFIPYKGNNGTLQENFNLILLSRGTIFHDNEAPSTNFDAQKLGITLATTGSIIIVPDYQGFGQAPANDVHPYLISDRSADAGVDMIRAVKQFCAARNIALTGKLKLMGGSEGGYITVATHKAIEERYSGEFNLRGSLPIVGPYDLSTSIMNDWLSSNSTRPTAILANLLLAYQDRYKLRNSLNMVIKEQYATTVSSSILGRKLYEHQINTSLPKVPRDLLTQEFLNDVLNNTNNTLRVALRQNDLFNWKPKAPIHFYHCAGDPLVSYANSQKAFDTMRALGATNVTLTDPLPIADHGACGTLSILNGWGWLDGL